MVKLDHDDVAQNADMGSVYDRLAAEFELRTYRNTPLTEERKKQMIRVYEEWTHEKFVPEVRVTAESAHLKPYDGVLQDDGWDEDCR